MVTLYKYWDDHDRDYNLQTSYVFTGSTWLARKFSWTVVMFSLSKLLFNADNFNNKTVVLLAKKSARFFVTSTILVMNLWTSFNWNRPFDWQTRVILWAIKAGIRIASFTHTCLLNVFTIYIAITQTAIKGAITDEDEHHEKRIWMLSLLLKLPQNYRLNDASRFNKVSSEQLMITVISHSNQVICS